MHLELDVANNFIQTSCKIIRIKLKATVVKVLQVVIVIELQIFCDKALVRDKKMLHHGSNVSLCAPHQLEFGGLSLCIPT